MPQEDNNLDTQSAVNVPMTAGIVPSGGQMRTAETLGLLHKGKLRYVFGTAAGWHWWDGLRWQPDASNHARLALVETLKQLAPLTVIGKLPASFLNEMNKASSQRAALDQAAHMPEFATELQQMDNHPHLLNCTNGTLNLRTFDLGPHDPNDMLTQVCNAAYEPDATSNLWDQFLTTTLPDVEVRNYLQRLIGYSLLGEVLHHIFPILVGDGGNGKGTFYESIMYALGDYAAPFDVDLLIQKHKDYGSANAPAPALLGLKGKRLVVTSETEVNARLATAKMKYYTGGDTITARAMYAKTNTVFSPSHTMFMVTNHEPMLSSDDGAAWQRITSIPFNIKIRGTSLEIPGFTMQLQNAADAILAWAVQGLRMYYEQGLAAPSQVLVRTEEYHAKTDSVASYIVERLVATGDPSSRTPRTQIWNDWVNWAKAEDVATGKQSDFYAKVAAHYETGTSHGARVFRGMVLASDSLDADLDLTELDNDEVPPTT